MTYVTPQEKYLLLSHKKQLTIPVLDVLYNHKYKFPFKKLNCYRVKNQMLNELRNSVHTVSETLIRGVIILEALLVEIDK